MFVHLSRISELLAPFLRSPLAEAQLAQLAAYLEILHRWNARMNLTAIHGPEQVVTRHFGESLFAAQHLFPPGRSLANEAVIDLGSGAGFPGLPIKIWAQELHVTLIESQNKKATFLKEVIRALELKDISVSTSRAEDLLDSIACHPERGRKSDSKDLVFSPPTVTLRAVEKFDRILSVAAQIATGGRLALLIGSVQVLAAQQFAPAFAWSDPLPIPQSLSRVLLVGESR